MTSKDKIMAFVGDKKQAGAKEIADFLGISRQLTHRHLAELVAKRQLEKTGRPPKVFYSIAENDAPPITYQLPFPLQHLINENFLFISAAGEKQEGVTGFVNWCHRQNLPVEKTAREYEQTLAKYATYKKDGLIDGMYKLKNTFPEIYLDEIFYLDFYAIERFGKTKLGQLLLYAKQSQDRKLIAELARETRPRVESLVEKFNVTAVAFIPPTVKREIQLMQELERQLNLALPKLELVKIKTPVVVPQKTLSKLGDRIENARDTIVVDDTKRYQTLLLIDDALGSGATLNETAKKIKQQKLSEKIIGLAITGSFSGFEVISEV